jgi:hypothetical protein
LSLHHEVAFGREICDQLGANGWIYEQSSADAYDRQLALYPHDLIAWVQEAQPAAWELLQKNHGTKASATLLERVRRQLDQVGSLDWEEHGGDRSFALAAGVVGDHPELAVFGGEVAGEEAAIAAAGGFVVGGFVVFAEVAPVAGGMAIEQGGDQRGGHGGGYGGGGHHTAEVVEHGTGKRRGKAGPIQPRHSGASLLRSGSAGLLVLALELWALEAAQESENQP